jgi:ectoine hydroxylase-related dioxygenase (phytanoyl-CoA dioxygenase family)
MTMQTLPHVTEEDKRAYREDGVVCLRGMFDGGWIDRIYTAIDRVMAAPGERAREGVKAGQSGRFHANSFMSRWDEDFRDFVLHSPGGAIAGQLLDADEIRFFYDQIFVKEPQTASITQWHQDLPFWPVRGEAIVSIWLALTPVTKETSGVQYAAGSHRWNKFYRAITTDEDPRFATAGEACPNFIENPDPAVRLLSWDMEPGDVLVHHPLTAHGAAGNASSDRRRLAISTRYMGADVTWDPRSATMLIPGDPGLPAGTPLTGDLFPVVWRRGSGNVA